jgi:hypothetical protein
MIKRNCNVKSFFIAFAVSCFPIFFYAQSYERVYAEAPDDVRSIMDQNKMNGKPILSGVYVQFIVALEYQFADIREFSLSMFDSDADVSNCVYDPNTSQLKIDCSPLVEMDFIKSRLTQEGWMVREVISKRYHSKEKN